jgi:IPT/TIG domain
MLSGMCLARDTGSDKEEGGLMRFSSLAIGGLSGGDGGARRARTWLAMMLAGGLLLCFAASVSASPISPAVTKIEPGTGVAAGGTAVTITGSEFVAVTEVKFGSRAAASFKVQSSTEITAVTPPWTSGNAIAEVTVGTLAATSTDSGGDSFIYEPTVTKIEPTGGPGAGGTSVTITGEAFEGLFENGAGEMPPFVSSVKFGANKAASFEVKSSTQITAVSPPGFGTQDVTVSTLGGTSASLAADRFAYATPPPSIEGESVSHVIPTDATLQAKINPESLERGAYYQFQLVAGPSEYLPVFACPSEGFPANSSFCGGLLASQPGALPIGRVGPGALGETVSLDLSAPRSWWSGTTTLKPGATYHYRVIAARSVPTEDTIQWEEPVVYGADGTFTTPPEPPNAGSGGQGSGAGGSQPPGSTGIPPKGVPGFHHKHKRHNCRRRHGHGCHRPKHHVHRHHVHRSASRGHHRGH